MIPLILATILLLLFLIAGFLTRALCRQPRGSRRRRAKGGAESDAFAGVDATPATPLEIRALKPRSQKWRFKKAMPKALETVPERLWFVKKAIRSKTYMTDETAPVDNPVIPEGFRLWAPPAAATARLADARREIAALFEREVALEEAKRLPFSDQRGSRGLYYIFTRELGEGLVKYEEAHRALLAEAPALADFCHEYLLYLARIYGIDAGVIADKAQLVLLRYEPLSGIWLHIDNVARYDRGPIATVSLGPPEVTYDFTPTLVDVGGPIRLRFREGDLAVMDGRARMEWAHGLPYGLDAYKYTVMFKCDHFTEHVVGYQPVLQTNIYEAIPARETGGGPRRAPSRRRAPEKEEAAPRRRRSKEPLGGFAG